MQELKQTEYLNGLKKLFNQYGVIAAYSSDYFDGNRRDGVVLWLDGADKYAANKITEYIDNYWNSQEYTPPELRSFCVEADGVDMSDTPCVYRDGRFYGCRN